MYISQLNLNLKSREVRSDISNCYEMHRTLCRAFPDKNNGGTGRILFRIDNNSQSIKFNTTSVIVVSEKKPNWDKIKNNNEYFIDYKLKDYNINLFEKQLLRFLLKANPTVKKDGKRKGLYGVKEQQEWFIRKADENGFKIIEYTSRQDEYLRNKNSKNIEFLSVIYEGVLQVTDVNKIKEALYKGIGSAKGFGFGLLSIARYQ